MATHIDRKRQEALRSAQALLKYYSGPPEVPFDAAIPAELQADADRLAELSGDQLIRLLVHNRHLLAALV